MEKNKRKDQVWKDAEAKYYIFFFQCWRVEGTKGKCITKWSLLTGTKYLKSLKLPLVS